MGGSRSFNPYWRERDVGPQVDPSVFGKKGPDVSHGNLWADAVEVFEEVRL